MCTLIKKKYEAPRVEIFPLALEKAVLMDSKRVLLLDYLYFESSTPGTNGGINDGGTL
jgi:hypothetical protein